MELYNLFKSMQVGFGLLLLISMFAVFVDLSDPDAAYYLWGFYTLVILFVLNLAIYVVNKFKMIIQLLKMGIKSRRALGLHVSLLAVHAGIAIVFMGNVLDLSLGFNQQVELRPGETYQLPASETMLKLQDFRIDYYEDGSPSQYTSQVLLTENDNKEIPCDITVNHPIEIAGSKVYQQSYGWMLNIEIANDNKSQKYVVKQREEVGLGDNSNKIEIVRYIPNYILGKMHGQGGVGTPAIVYFIPLKNITGLAKLGEKIKISDDDTLTFIDKQAFTVLKVKTSPGLPLVQVGGILLVMGIILVFLFRSNQSSRLNIGSKDVSNK